MSALKGECASVTRAAELLVQSLRDGGKLVTFGNGGSASDAQHIAAELVGRYLKERRALPAIALTVNTSILTAVANDYGYDRIFARQVEALVKAGDVIIALSTSGNSSNVLEGVREAKRRGAQIIGLTGRSGGLLHGLADVSIRVPSDETPRIQEAHILIGHVLCELAERELG
ncbi:MAG: D-sedoheptulose 7-phosphate isomerase [Clostridia bacterium]|nr:D-sedoheptulose 7-phosphate isomerase [Deltaproteobacteria bacterium]